MKTSPRQIQRAVYEMSLKAFNNAGRKNWSEVARTVIKQWANLTSCTREISVMLWIGTGDELLLWNNDLKSTFPWAKTIGFCNMVAEGKGPYNIEMHKWSHHAEPYLPESELHNFTYGDLKEIVKIIKQAGREAGLRVMVGTTLDSGPEFAEAEFRYKRHPELTPAMPGDPYNCGFRFIDFTLNLAGDSFKYAGFPEGIPDKTPFATFIGRQSKLFCREMDLDYVWFSNGFGYSRYPWYLVGRNFDGATFGLIDAKAEADKLVAAWENFRREAPDLRVEVRGTNFPLGVDVAVHTAPLHRIHAAGKVRIPPVNPPWGSMDMGMEITAHMTRIAELPANEFAVRLYFNDSWFRAIPWWTYYNREAFDIYSPLSV